MKKQNVGLCHLGVQPVKNKKLLCFAIDLKGQHPMVKELKRIKGVSHILCLKKELTLIIDKNLIDQSTAVKIVEQTHLKHRAYTSRPAFFVEGLSDSLLGENAVRTPHSLIWGKGSDYFMLRSDYFLSFQAKEITFPFASVVGYLRPFPKSNYTLNLPKDSKEWVSIKNKWNALKSGYQISASQNEVTFRSDDAYLSIDKNFNFYGRVIYPNRIDPYQIFLFLLQQGLSHKTP